MEEIVSEEVHEESDDGEKITVVDKQPLVADEEQEEEQEQVEEEFHYTPSAKLKRIESGLSDADRSPIDDGKVKESLTAAFEDSMQTDVAQQGLADVKNEWQLMMEGPFARMVIGTFGQNFVKIVTSQEGADMINMLAATASVLLQKAGAEKRAEGLNRAISMTFMLFTSPEMPEIVNKSGQLLIAATNKRNATQFAERFWAEVKDVLTIKNLDHKLAKCFTNIRSMMKTLYNQSNGSKRVR